MQKLSLFRKLYLITWKSELPPKDKSTATKSLITIPSTKP
jgi:hypothetical protein